MAVATGPDELSRLLATMEAGDASDLFVCEGKPPAIRKHGAVVALPLAPIDRPTLDRWLDQLLPPGARERFDASGDLDCGYSLDDERRFRLNLSRQQGRVALVARALPSGELRLADLGLPPAVERFAALSRGLVLITGATGSGKSTTLAALIHRINSTRPVHIVSIEDPIEFVHRDRRARISQREVGADTASFSTALRHILRESPDVIVIGEMRDRETMQVAIAAALTGHLVLATVHTIDAVQTVQRVLTTFADHERPQAALDLSQALEGIVSQRLLPRRDQRGRVVAIELLTCTPAAKHLLREQRLDELLDLMQSTQDPGMVTFNRALLDLYQRELIPYELGLAYATNPDEFKLSARGVETGTRTFQRDVDEAPDAARELDLKALLERAVELKASDLHVAVGRPPIFRVCGELDPMAIDPLSAADLRALLYAVMTVRQRTRYELDRELDFALQLDSGHRFRVNAYYQKGQMAAALRAIPTRIPEADELAIPDVVLKLADRPHGLLLVVGPTGSGKTTTMACLVDRINQRRKCRVITVEDPIEYTHESAQATVDQREVGADTLSFGAALKYILRQDPDVILIGEMRDLETVGAALTAAETGHLVLATLHSNDAAQTIDRVVDVFPTHQQSQARAQLAGSLLGVISQRLLQRRDGRGRIAAFEVMVATPAIRTLIRDQKMHQARSMLESSRGQGMVTLDKALRDLVDGNQVAFEEALRHVTNPAALGARARVELDPADFGLD